LILQECLFIKKDADAFDFMCQRVEFNSKVAVERIKLFPK